MSKIKFAGPLSLRIQSFLTLNRIAVATYLRHLAGRKMAPDWDANMEIGIRFVRHQFSRAMRGGSIARGRQLFDSLQLETDDIYNVTVAPGKTSKGDWYHPADAKGRKTILYFHGGGYTFHGAISRRFAAMLCHRTGLTLFAPDYRLTPEHPHPAQSDDALAAWKHVTAGTPPENTIVIGDSAGGHMALMLLQRLKSTGQAQPALCIALCPWTDIGDRGASLSANDQYDLVQGWMALQFGTWLDPDNRLSRRELSPIQYDFKDTAPIYIQTGAREVLHDMIADFAAVQKERGADIDIDTWEDMPHNFQAYDQLTRSSRAAIAAIVERCRKI